MSGSIKSFQSTPPVIPCKKANASQDSRGPRSNWQRCISSGLGEKKKVEKPFPEKRRGKDRKKRRGKGPLRRGKSKNGLRKSGPNIGNPYQIEDNKGAFGGAPRGRRFAPPPWVLLSLIWLGFPIFGPDFWSHSWIFPLLFFSQTLLAMWGPGGDLISYL